MTENSNLELKEEIERLREDNKMLHRIVEVGFTLNECGSKLIDFWEEDSRFWTKCFFILFSIVCVLVIFLIAMLCLNEVWVGGVCLSCWGK